MTPARLLFAAALAAALAAGATRAAEKSLYERLGGEPALTAVVDDFVDHAAADPRVDFTRGGRYQLDVPRLKRQLLNLVGQLTGGPQKYTGKDMRTLHAGMKITAAQFDALAADLAASLEKFKVPGREKDELLTIVGSTRKDIVAPPVPPRGKRRR
jgi:hemoglobin